MDAKGIIKDIQSADAERIDAYLRMFDRILLYTMAANSMPIDILNATLGIWEQVAKKSIDIDATKRTTFLESTPTGRALKLNNEPDGEDLRLHWLKQWNIAKNVITSNLIKNDTNEEDDDEQIN